MTTTHRTVSLPESRTGTAAATWGQRMMWHWIDWMGPSAEQFTIVQRVHIPDGVGVDDVLDSVGLVVMRHESLRTRFLVDDRRELRQRLVSPPSLDVEVRELAADDTLESVVAALVGTLSATRFDPAADWPLRVVVVTAHGAPVVALLALSHLAVDLLSSRIVRHELTQQLAARAGGVAPPPLPRVRQPLEHAEHERSDKGLRIAATSLAYWRNLLDTAPRTMFPFEPHQPEEDRYWSGTLTSRAVGPAAGVLARRYGAGTSTVLLAATAVLLGRHTGTTRCVLRLNSGNRVGRDLHHAVGVLSQDVPATIDVSGQSFRDVVHGAWSASVRAYRHAQYQWPRVEELVRQASARRGVDLDLACFFNDLRSDLAAHPDEATPDEIRAAAAETTFAWTRSWSRDALRFRLHVADEGAATIIGVLVDTCCLTRDQGRELVKGIEHLLVELVTSDVDLDATQTLSGITGPRRGDDDVHIDGCRVDLRAVERLLRDAVDPVAVAADVEQSPNGTVLVCYLVPREPDLTPERVHEACMSLLPGRQTAMAPHRYVLCDSGDPWRVRTAGTGRLELLQHGAGPDEPRTDADEQDPVACDQPIVLNQPG